MQFKNHLLSAVLLFSCASLLGCGLLEEDKCAEADSFECATTYEEGKTYRGRITSGSNHDYGKLELKEDGILELQLDESGPGTLSVMILTSPESGLGDSKYTSDGRAIKIARAKKGTYYILVEGSVSVDHEYSVNVKVDRQDQYEWNDEIASARQISVGTPVSVRLYPTGDKDYFKFTPSVTGAYKITFEGVNDSNYFSTAILDKNLNTKLLYTGLYGDDGSAMLLAGEEYYLLLQGGSVVNQAFIATIQNVN